MDVEEVNQDVETPLLSAKVDHEEEESLNKSEIVKEVKRQLKLAGPLICVNFLFFSVQLISTMMVGHLGDLPLSGASMATSFTAVTGFGLLIGMGSALDTFCGQSYGAKQYHMLGIHMQRAMLVLLLTSIPLAFACANTDKILTFLGQDPEIASEAGVYSRYLVPSIFAYGLLQCHIKFLQAQNNVIPMMVTAGFTTLVHVLICWVLVFKSSLGSKGAALSSSISYWVNVLLLAIYVRGSPSCKETWTGFSKEAFHGIPEFFRLAIPSAIMTCLEMWSFEMIVLIAGLLPNAKLETSVLSISFNTNTVIYMIPMGLGAAISTRVSNELGAGQPRLARLAVCVSMSIVGVEWITIASVFIFGHKFWGYCYSSDQVVVKYVGEMLLLFACSHLLECTQTVLSGTARGCGWQKIGAFVNLGAYYLVGIPCALLFAFVCHVGGKGLWLGLMVALFVQALSLLIITLRSDWNKEAKKATERVHRALVH